jgi:hypothetical protein
MKKVKTIILMVIVISIAAGGTIFSQEAPLEPEPDPTGTSVSVYPTCIIDLDNNTYRCNCWERFAFIVKPEDHKAVLQIRLDRVLFTSALINARYTGTPQRMTMNVGDSRTNDGYGGDYGTQSNDAEFQIVDTTFTVYGNDYMYAEEGTNFLHKLKNVLRSDIDSTATDMIQTISFLVENESLTMEYPSIQPANYYLYNKQTYTSPYLYALAGQPDREGPVNYDIYAGFNRSIYSPERIGSGLGYVVITLLPNPDPVCVIDLENNTYETNNPGRFQFTAPPEDHMAALRIALDPAAYTTAAFEVTYGTKPEGWTLNIGDSATNNGGGGDSGTQSNDAELQILDNTFSLFGNDLMYRTHGFNFLYDVENVVEEEETILIEAANNQMKLENRNETINTGCPYLYALAGQPDWEGEVNYDIYAAFNRVIDGPYRRGRGVSKVVIILKPGNAAVVPDDTEENPEPSTGEEAAQTLSDSNEFGLEEVTFN